MNRPALPLDDLDQFLAWFAAAIAALITFLPALGYLAFAWHEAGLNLEHQSRVQATSISRFVSRNPDVWHDTRERLLDSLAGLDLPFQHTLVIDNARGTIGELGVPAPHAPVLSREAVFFEFGVPVGVVRVEASMEEELKIAGFILLLSGLLGALVFGPLRRIPLAALTDSMRQLESSEERFRRLTEMSSDWYWTQDTANRYAFMSSGAERSGKEVTAFLGKTPWEQGTGVSAEAWAAHRCLLDARKPFKDFRYAIRIADGEERWLSVSGEPTFDAQGVFAGYHGTARDETLRNRAENIIRNQKEVLSEMVERKTADLQAALATSQQALKGQDRNNSNLP
jgi:PAS domain S-box-containing protein